MGNVGDIDCVLDCIGLMRPLTRSSEVIA